MKLKLKMMAVAAAIVTMTGAANAAIVSDFTGNGTVVLQAFNTVTQAWYYRDLGFQMDSFLPGPTALTPTSGLTLTAPTAPNFADASGWTTWITGQTLSDIRWTVTANANDPGFGANRAIFASANPNETMANGEINNFVSSSFAGGAEGASQLTGIGGTPNVSFFFSSGVDGNLAAGYGIGIDSLSLLGGSSSLFYAIQTGFVGPSNQTRYGNGSNFAVVSLSNTGEFSYTLGAEVAAVPLPAAAWLLGAGLVAMGGAARRRKVAAAAQA